MENYVYRAGPTGGVSAPGRGIILYLRAICEKWVLLQHDFCRRLTPDRRLLTGYIIGQWGEEETLHTPYSLSFARFMQN